MTYDEVYRQISGVNYSEAISHYNSLKDRFFKELSIVSGVSKESAIEAFQEKIINQFNNEDHQILENLQDTNQLYEDLEYALLEAFRGDGKANLRQTRSRLQEKYGSEFKKDNIDLLKEAEALFSNEELEKIIWEHLYSSYGITRGMGVDISDIFNRMARFRNKVFIQKVVQKRGGVTAHTRSASSTKGYFREAMIHKSFYELFSYLDSALPDYALMHTGGTTTGGRQSEMDEYINFLGAIQNYSRQISQEVDSGYGIQSKSYVSPWKRDMSAVDPSMINYLFGVGSRSDLLKSFVSDSKSKGFSPGWIANINYLGQKANTLAALGKSNIFYSTGDGFYPTADLIEKFRSDNYFLSFIFKKSDSKWIPNSSITWQQIDMSKS